MAADNMYIEVDGDDDTRLLVKLMKLLLQLMLLLMKSDMSLAICGAVAELN